MTFLLRFCGWALLLALPAWAYGDAYRAGLARALEAVFGLLGRRLELERVDALAPMDLALFAALTLASDAWSRKDRARALLAGLPALAALQLVVWTLYLSTLMSPGRGARDPGEAARAWQSVLGAAAWLAALAAWLLGPGSAMLARAAGDRPPARPRPGRGSAREP